VNTGGDALTFGQIGGNTRFNSQQLGVFSKVKRKNLIIKKKSKRT
jgi:hypothetical protein